MSTAPIDIATALSCIPVGGFGIPIREPISACKGVVNHRYTASIRAALSMPDYSSQETGATSYRIVEGWLVVRILTKPAALWARWQADQMPVERAIELAAQHIADPGRAPPPQQALPIVPSWRTEAIQEVRAKLAALEAEEARDLAEWSALDAAMKARHPQIEDAKAALRFLAGNG